MTLAPESTNGIAPLSARTCFITCGTTVTKEACQVSTSPQRLCNLIAVYTLVQQLKRGHEGSVALVEEDGLALVQHDLDVVVASVMCNIYY